MKKENIYKILLIGLFALISITVPVATIISSAQLPENAFSENENRYLEKMPEFNFDTVTDKSFMTKFENFFADRIVMREQWIGLMNDFDRILGKKEIKGIFTEDGRMMQSWRTGDYSVDSVNKNLSAMEKFAEKYPKIKMYFMLAPNAQEIYSDTLPANCGAADQKLFIKSCYESLPNITGIDVYSGLLAAKNEYIYYRTDHHWTSYGAYIGYKSAASAMNFTAYSEDKFSVEHASNEFRGTLYSKTLDNSITPDTIDIYALANNEPQVKVSVYKSGAKPDSSYNSLYFREFLDVKDKYSTFLGQNVPRIDIESEIPKEYDKGNLLVIKDSYAHSLIPFLTKNYIHITVLDLRYINSDLSNIGVNPKDYENVLFMYNVITFSQDTNVKKLDFIVK
mgnify:FL=1